MATKTGRYSDADQKGIKLGFKTLIRNCLKRFLLFNNSLSATRIKEDDWQFQTVQDQFQQFLQLYQKAVTNEEIDYPISITCTEAGNSKETRWQVKSEVLNFVFFKIDLIRINEIFEQLRKITIASYEGDRIPDEYTHFIYLGDHRIVPTEIKTESENLSEKDHPLYTESYEGTWISPRHFRNNAIKAIKKGTAYTSVGKGMALHSIEHLYFNVKPITQFSEEYSFSHNLFRLISSDVISEWKKDNYYQVPSVERSKFKTFNEIVCALFVQFFMEHGDFKRMSVCEYCDSLYIESQEDYQIYCSHECNQSFHREKRSKEKNACRENKRGWYKRHTKHSKIPMPTEKCEDCITFGGQGGDCDLLWEEYKNVVIPIYKKKKGESIFMYLCRTKQLDYFSESLNKKRGQIATLKFCRFCHQCKDDVIPEPGKCERILEKFKDKKV